MLVQHGRINRNRAPVRRADVSPRPSVVCTRAQYLRLLYQILVLVHTIDSTVPTKDDTACTMHLHLCGTNSLLLAHLLACSMETKQSKASTDRFCFEQVMFFSFLEMYFDHNVEQSTMHAWNVIPNRREARLVT